MLESNSMYFEELVGNQQTKSMLMIAAKSARERNTSVPHVLFGGSAGTGKTSFSRALANFLDVPFFQVDPGGIKSAEDLYRTIEQFPLDGYGKGGEVEGDITPPVLFLDEIHQISLRGSEHLGIAMENFILPIEVGRGKQKEKRVIWVPRFTVIGATTLTGKLPKPLRDRFKIQCKFGAYSEVDSWKIVLTHAKKMNLKIDPLAAMLIARRGRGVARTLVRFLEMARDHSIVHGKDIIDVDVVMAMFEFLGIDENGLNPQDVSVLKCLHQYQEPVGLDSLAVLLNESQDTISKEVEPYLMIKGLIQRTPKGRTLTDSGVQYVEKFFGGAKEKSSKLDLLTIKKE